jgi:hypothetical protein
MWRSRRKIMNALKKILKIVAIVFIVAVVFLFFYLPTLRRSGKPRENQLALLECRLFLNAASLGRTNGAFFDFLRLSDDNKHRALGLVLNDLDYLVKTNFAWGTSSNVEVVIVCPTEFDNVPEPFLLNLYHRNPAHAVGYSDGKTGLISPKQYINLNISGFVSAWSLATNSEFGIYR